jgi:ABC-type amino acid transport substrate-binding protein
VRALQLSTSYLNETLGFVMRDSERTRYATWEALRQSGPLTLAVPAVGSFVDTIRERLPHARLLAVENVGQMFSSRADAFVLPAERAAAWTLRYPQYAVIVPLPGVVKVPLAFALPTHDPEWTAFVNTWIDLKRNDGTLAAAYEYWILGRVGPSAAPRWSIIRDVLHWVD